MQLAKEQKVFGPYSLLACLVIVQFSTIIAVDMYAPALTALQDEFGVSASYLNLTMFLFLVVAAVAVVIAGPLSDRIGRKPLLVGGSVIFALSSLGCAAAPNVAVLVLFRMGEAIGYGVITTVVASVVEDAYEGKSLKTAMTCVQSFVVIGPAIAPFLGTGILSVSGWRMIFVALAIFGLAASVLSLLVTETSHPEARKQSSGVGQALSGMFRDVKGLLRNKSFTSLTLILGIMGVPYFAFISVASYVILDYFGESYLVYSLLYSAICIVSVIAPFVYSAMTKKLHGSTVVKFCLVLTFASAVLLVATGHMSAWLFLVALIPYALAEGINRPLCFMVLLDQPEELVGSASSCANFAYSIIPAFATVIATLPWPDYVVGVTFITIVSLVLCVILYAWGLRGQSLDKGFESNA